MSSVRYFFSYEYVPFIILLRRAARPRFFRAPYCRMAALFLSNIIHYSTFSVNIQKRFRLLSFCFN